jgi:hypothetical protein
VRGIGQQKIEEVAIISKDTKGARYVASSLSGRELDALVVKCRLGQNLIIQKEEETN